MRYNNIEVIGDSTLQKMLWQAASEEVDQMDLDYITWKEREELIALKAIKLLKAKMKHLKELYG
ncbi:MAG: hypothetical protein K0R73_677 [Candidatus Midichloriaceae bacterium]|jgi:hypothetical protein|nr:hypothetical protein [Candidatus Midichloriaceae bacterium]